MKKIYKLLSKILFNVFAVLFGIILVGGNIMLSPNAAGQINSIFNVKTQETITSDDEDVDTLYYKSDYESIAELKENAGEVVAKVTEEGAVLLKNAEVNGAKALPLSSGAKVNLYSINSVNYIFQGGGSSLAKRAENLSLKEGLTEAGLVVNEALWNFYTANADNAAYKADHNSNTSSDKATYSIKDVPWNAIGSGRDEAAEAGIFVLSRYGTEATDLYMNGGSSSDTTNGDYLELSPNEISVLKGMKALKDSGKLKKIVMLLNSVNQVQCDYVDKAEYGIDAVLWVGEGGATGTKGIGRILAGKSPSGKLTDTYWVEHYFNPVYANFGEFVNAGETVPGGIKSTKYLVYQEDIYNGYRYTETRYEDTVLKTAKAGTFNYNEIVKYPFGYGLSYTEFEYSDFDVEYNEKTDVYTAKVTVKNVGSVKGKEAVQLYLQKPYTDYDKQNGIEKSAIDFVGFAKTEELAPNATQTLNIEVKGSELASYDSNKAKTYILDAGDYYFTAAKNAHEAVNNVLAAKGKTKSDGMTDDGVVAMTKKFTKTFDDKTYATSAATGKAITNAFDDADLNRYDGKGNNSVAYMTRNDWEGTVKLGLTKTHARLNNEVKVTATAKMASDAAKGSTKLQKDDVAYPTYGNGTYDKTLGSLLSIKDDKLEKVEYDDERWEEILDQLTWEDTVMLLSNGLRKTWGLEIKTETIDGNGALGPVGATSAGADAYRYSSNQGVAELRYAFLYDDPDKDTSPVAYPCAALMAATMNEELIHELGNSIGEDCLWAGYSGLYGPGANIHRGAYNGRAFEYYSEDGYLSGKITAAEIRGIREKGVYVYLKHAVLNEQEHNREGVNTWANEQTIREIYLKPFEIGIIEGGAENVMTGFNRIGVDWTSQHGFINTVLRDEFGMKGFAVSDYWQANYMDLAGGILGGSALPDGDLAVKGASDSPLNQYKTGYGKLANAMREEAHKILYVVVNSSAMNGVTASTRYITITPAWMGVVGAIQIVFGVLFGLTAVAFILTSVWDKLPFAKKAAENA